VFHFFFTVYSKLGMVAVYPIWSDDPALFSVCRHFATKTRKAFPFAFALFTTFICPTWRLHRCWCFVENKSASFKVFQQNLQTLTGNLQSSNVRINFIPGIFRITSATLPPTEWVMLAERTAFLQQNSIIWSLWFLRLFICLVSKRLVNIYCMWDISYKRKLKLFFDVVQNYR